MIIRIGMAPRRIGTSFTEFQRHWREEHSAVAQQIPGLRGYVQNHSILDGAGRPLLPYPGFDACAETAFDDLAGMDAAFGSPTYQGAVRADEDLLIDKSRFFLLLCDRVVIDGGGAEDGIKLMTFMRAHPLVNGDKLRTLASGRYADLVKSAGAIRHVQLIPSLDLHVGRQPPSCELVECVWFETTQHALDFVNGSAGSEADDLLGGKVFGRERLLASARVVRELHTGTDQGAVG